VSVTKGKRYTPKSVDRGLSPVVVLFAPWPSSPRFMSGDYQWRSGQDGIIRACLAMETGEPHTLGDVHQRPKTETSAPGSRQQAVGGGQRGGEKTAQLLCGTVQVG
jgi:hypothetical protein